MNESILCLTDSPTDDEAREGNLCALALLNDGKMDKRISMSRNDQDRNNKERLIKKMEKMKKMEKLKYDGSIMLTVIIIKFTSCAT